MSPTLVLSDVACRRGGRLLFEHLSLSMAAGDAAVLTGPNGVGKSSLLRMIAGLLPAERGQVRTDGPIALADEALALDRELPLARALAFWARIDGGDFGSALSALALDMLADVPVRMLSTGQRKRAVLARVLASGAPIWLLDEPGNGLDTASLKRLEAMVAKHRADGGIVLAASHQPLAMPGAAMIALEAAR